MPEASTEKAMAMGANREFTVWWATPVECASALQRLATAARREGFTVN